MRCKNCSLKHFYNTFLNLYLTDFQYFILKFVKLFLSHIIIGKHYTKLQYVAGKPRYGNLLDTGYLCHTVEI